MYEEQGDNKREVEGIGGTQEFGKFKKPLRSYGYESYQQWKYYNDFKSFRPWSGQDSNLPTSWTWTYRMVTLIVFHPVMIERERERERFIDP